MDNGWNSELAQNNISNLVKSLNVDLYTHVIDWEEYKNLQKLFLKQMWLILNYYTIMQ